MRDWCHDVNWQRCKYSECNFIVTGAKNSPYSLCSILSLRVSRQFFPTLRLNAFFNPLARLWWNWLTPPLELHNQIYRMHISQTAWKVNTAYHSAGLRMERMMDHLTLSAVPNSELALTRTLSVSITNCNVTVKPFATESAHTPYMEYKCTNRKLLCRFHKTKGLASCHCCLRSIKPQQRRALHSVWILN